MIAMTKETIARILHLWSIEHLTTAQISKILGVPEPNVDRIVNHIVVGKRGSDRSL